MTEERRRRRRRPLTRVERVQRRLRQLVRGRRRGAVIAAVVVVVGIVWIGWTVWSARSALVEVEERGRVVQAALVRGDADGARRAMADYQDAAESAESRTGGLTWSVLELLPLVGDDLEAVAVVSGVLADLGRDGLPPIADAADLVTADTFRPQNGVFPVEKIAAMEEPAERSEQAFDDAAAALGDIDSSGFIGPVRTRFDELRELVTEARATLGSTYRAARLIPRMMGTDRPRFYLMVLQNNAELRSGGGLPGALSLVRMKDGAVKIVDQLDMSDLGGSTVPVVPLTAEEKKVFGSILGVAAVDATLTPDFERSAEIIGARWEREVGGQLDGVIFVDPVAVSYLLLGTGPVAVPGFVPVTPANVVAGVENAIYLRTNDRQVHSDYQQAVAEAVFDAFASGRGSTVAMIRGLATAVAEGRVRMHSFEPESQAEIAGTAIAGEFSDEASVEPEVGIYINDGGPTKMQYYLKYDASVIARSCVDERQVISGSIEFHSDTPPDAASLPASITGAGFRPQRAAPGEQLLVVYVTSPVGGEVTELSIDGQKVARPVVEELAGRSLVRVGIRLEPQARHKVEFVMRSGKAQTGDVRLAVTPGAFPGSSNGTVPSSCTVR